jgi:predicted RNA-binding Zn ribbon-like protein
MELPRLLGGALALDFVNTVDPRFGDAAREYLDSPAAVGAWSAYAGLPRVRIGATELRDVLELRELLYRLLRPSRRRANADVARVGELYAAALRSSTLVAAPDGVHWRPRETGSLPALVVPVVESALSLLAPGPVIRECPADNCGWLFVDRSKNGTRRWCSMEGCGSRAKMQRYRARRQHA